MRPRPRASPGSTGGRPGLAVAYAAAAEAEAIRGELARTLLDLLAPGRVRDRLARRQGPRSRGRWTLDALLAPLRPAAVADAPDAPGLEPHRRAGRRHLPGDRGPSTRPPDEAAAEEGARPPTRRRALALLLDAVARRWRATSPAPSAARAASIRDIALLEEIEAAARRPAPAPPATALARLVRAGELLAGNASPELVLDVLLVRWPRRRRAA